MAADNPLPETPAASLPSDLRVAPRQARARETVAHILDTAAELLDEVGVDGFNTNRLAERAGVRVRTVYRYFPNKTAVIVALAERVMAEWEAHALPELERMGTGPGRDWRAEHEAATRGLIEALERVPGYTAIRRAMRAVPELHAIDQADNVRLAAAHARGLRRLAPELSPARARRAARCLVESAAAVLDVAFEGSRAEGKAMVDELIAMQAAYLETLLP